MSRTSPAPSDALRPGFAEFVVLMAGLMSLNALAIDAMVPALPAIGESLAVAAENDRQLVVAAYMFGFGTTQLIYGPLSDRFGRKPVLVFSLVLYIGFSLACAAAASFTLLIAARLAQGASAAATRVLVVSIIRDRYEGASMARLLSLVHLVFLIMPVLAPTFGQLTLLVASWRWIFLGLAIFGSLMLAWATARLPETLRAEHRRSLSAGDIARAAHETLTNRQSLGYTLAFTLMMGALVGYIVSIQQIVFDVYERPELIALAFAGIAVPMAASSYANSRLVERIGTRRIAHLSLVLFTAFAALHLGVASFGESFAGFILLQGLTMAAFAIGSANFGALAMQPLGHIAGTASSVQGTIGTIGGAAIGTALGQAFDGTPMPLLAGFAGFGAGALVVILLTERGRLFGID
ncbi:multidrug effflux MFS transporter [Sphingosinicella terrae]|uniref:multidrug effflux MFS transporter n=1 Tax=Sphingosinicella terrae TaxID=2172047 RepID=UPI000E0CD623|nr:multidrug effflux MFS transporter [Sphingosinicella terrae]